MFDLTSSKLLILAVVALIVVGPKDLPILLRTIGKYLSFLRQHANEFRAQLDEALRESELEEVKKEFDRMGQEVRATMDAGTRALDAPVMPGKPVTPEDAAAKSEPATAPETAPEAEAPEAATAVSAPPAEKTGTGS
jgi:sec-independent protein translocase protein TatB